MIKFSKTVFYISLILLIIISLFPGSLIGYLFYGDWGQQPDLIPNPFGTSINHFFSYAYVSLLGLFLHLKNKKLKKIVYGLLFLSIILEVCHLIIPNRSFHFSDLIANILGVIVEYTVVKIYLLFNK
jgi:VanZ family protein